MHFSDGNKNLILMEGHITSITTPIPQHGKDLKHYLQGEQYRPMHDVVA
jgi:hypothetical protein